MPTMGLSARRDGGPLSERSAIRPDLVDDLHAADSLPEEEGQHAHVQPNMGLPGNQVALLHQWRKRGRNGDHPGHGQTHKQVRTQEQFAVVQVRHRHATQGPQRHHSQEQAAPAVMTLGELAWDELLALLRGPGAGLLRLDAQIKRPAPSGQQSPFR